jgi:hypothetical protein
VKEGTNHLLVLELLGNIAGSRSRNLDPGLGEERACREHEGDVDGGMDRVEKGCLEGARRGDVVRDTRGSGELRRFIQSLHYFL